MKELFAIFIGSGLGGLTRFLLGKWINNYHDHLFPFATFFVNIIACLLLGFVIGLADHKQMLSPVIRLFWVAGFCGGFSTFSTFSNETLMLFRDGHNTTMLVYILLSVLLCVIAIFAGLYLAERIY